MDTETIRKLVIEVLHEVQTESGREWVDLSDRSKPIGLLDGFDSLTGIEATVILEERLRISLGVENIFVSQEGDRALRLGEIVTSIAAVVARRGE